ERLMLCDYAVADLSTANANVFYELGIRHAIRPRSTALIMSKGMRLPFDVAPLRALPYEIDANGLPARVAEDRKDLAALLNKCREPKDERPLYQLVTDLPRRDIARLKTDVFRAVVEYSRKYKLKLTAARQNGSAAISAVQKELGKIADVDPA